jgi:hypothetical protein
MRCSTCAGYEFDTSSEYAWDRNVTDERYAVRGFCGNELSDESRHAAGPHPMGLHCSKAKILLQSFFMLMTVQRDVPESAERVS